MHDRPPEPTPRGTAFHEAGHAVAALDAGFAFRAVSMRSGDLSVPGRHGGVLDVDRPPSDQSGRIPAEPGWPVAVFYMAGPEAERMETGRPPWWVVDRITLEQHVDIGPTWAAQNAYVRRAAEEARALLAAHWAEVEALAEALLEHERLTYAEALRIARVS
ncbi:MAG: hypothetical protein H0V18_17665 [Pyrinomonadaceae bacterium]|nr:hypothetical protein [Pyrinomonadaceae bacterium]